MGKINRVPAYYEILKNAYQTILNIEFYYLHTLPKCGCNYYKAAKPYPLLPSGACLDDVFYDIPVITYINGEGKSEGAIISEPFITDDFWKAAEMTKEKIQNILDKCSIVALRQFPEVSINETTGSIYIVFRIAAAP